MTIMKTGININKMSKNIISDILGIVYLPTTVLAAAALKLGQ